MPADPAPAAELRSERLLLRPFADSDADFLFDLYRRPEVQRYIGRVPRVMADRSEAVQLIERVRVPLDRPDGRWLIVGPDAGEPAGVLLLNSLPASTPDASRPPSGETEIGWHPAPAGLGTRHRDRGCPAGSPARLRRRPGQVPGPSAGRYASRQCGVASGRAEDRDAR